MTKKLRNPELFLSEANYHPLKRIHLFLIMVFMRKMSDIQPFAYKLF